MVERELIKLKENLPEHPGILGRDKYFNAAVLIPLVLKGGECHFLFQKRAADIRQAGEICFPGGKSEPQVDLDYKQTAIRETIEELSIDKDQIKIIGRLDTLLAPMGVAIDAFIGIVQLNSANKLDFNQKEVAEVFTLPVSYFEANQPLEYKVKVEVKPSYIDEGGAEIILLPSHELGLPEKYTRPWSGKNYRIFVYQTAKGVIWGMTAELIKEVVNLLSRKADLTL